jgi:hypothetical protein
MAHSVYFIIFVIYASGTYAMKARHAEKSDADGQLTALSVLSAALNETHNLQNEVFAAADADENGLVSIDELRKLDINTDVATIAVQNADTNLDGMISQYEMFNQPFRRTPYAHFRESQQGGNNNFFAPSCLLEKSQNKYWTWVAATIRDTTTVEASGGDVGGAVGAMAKEGFKNSARAVGFQQPLTALPDVCARLMNLRKLVDIKNPGKWIQWNVCDTKEFISQQVQDPVGNFVTGIPTTNADRERAAKRIDDYYIGSKSSC